MKFLYTILGFIGLCLALVYQPAWGLSLEFWEYYKTTHIFWQYLPGFMLAMLMVFLATRDDSSDNEKIFTRVVGLIFFALGQYILAILFWIALAGLIFCAGILTIKIYQLLKELIRKIFVFIDAVLLGIIMPFLRYLFLPEKWSSVLPISTLWVRISKSFKEKLSVGKA